MRLSAARAAASGVAVEQVDGRVLPDEYIEIVNLLLKRLNLRSEQGIRDYCAMMNLPLSKVWGSIMMDLESVDDDGEEEDDAQKLLDLRRVMETRPDIPPTGSKQRFMKADYIEALLTHKNTTSTAT